MTEYLARYQIFDFMCKYFFIARVTYWITFSIYTAYKNRVGCWYVGWPIVRRCTCRPRSTPIFPIIPIYLRNLVYFLYYLTFSFYFLYFHVSLHPCIFFFFRLLPDKHSRISPIFREIIAHLCIIIARLKNIILEECLLRNELFRQLVQKITNFVHF